MSPFKAIETCIQRLDIEMDREGAIRNAMKGVNDHKAGLPEFMKNAAGAYYRISQGTSLGRSHHNRCVVLLFRSPRGRRGGSVGCLDLVGMTREDMRLFQHWFDPTAAARGDSSGELWGGHGNGAKSYMLNMFNQSWFATIRDGYFTRMGWTSGSLQIGYIPSRRESGGARVAKPIDLLDELLRTYFGANLAVLPQRAQKILSKRPCWTCFMGVGAKNWVNPDRLLGLLQNNPQAIRTIEYCNIYAFIDGNLALDGRPLTLQPIPPLPGGEGPYEIPVPTRLVDPEGGEVDTTSAGRYPAGRLALYTSRDTMLYTLKHRHIIQCESTTKGIYALYPVQDLAGRQADHIYGVLHLDAMQDYETNFRTRPHDAPLTRAVESWIGPKIIEYANRFREQEEDRHADQEMNELREFNEDMNRFLQSFLEEMEAEGGGGEGGTETLTGTGRGALPAGEVVSIEHSLGDGVSLCGENVVIYVRLSFFDSEGKRVRPVPVHWESSDETVAYVRLGSIITGSPGECQIWAIAENGVRSSPVHIKVLNVRSIEITPNTDVLPVGSRRHLEYRATCGDAAYTDVMLDWHSSDEEFVKVGTNTGVITATAGPGVAEVWASSHGIESNRIQINTSGEGAGGPKPRYPRVLLSEIDDDPDNGRPKRIDPEAGTVVQDVADRRRHIYWVNMRSPLAEPFYREREGLGYRSPEFMMYFAERYAEVLFRNSLGGSDNQWEPSDIEELLRDRPTLYRQALARHLPEFLRGEWRPE